MHPLSLPDYDHSCRVNVYLENQTEANYSSQLYTGDLELDTTHTAWPCLGSCSLVLNPGGVGNGKAPDWLLLSLPSTRLLWVTARHHSEVQGLAGLKNNAQLHRWHAFKARILYVAWSRVHCIKNVFLRDATDDYFHYWLLVEYFD